MQAVNKEVVVKEHDHQHDICTKPRLEKTKTSPKSAKMPPDKINWGG